MSWWESPSAMRSVMDTAGIAGSVKTKGGSAAWGLPFTLTEAHELPVGSLGLGRNYIVCVCVLRGVGREEQGACLPQETGRYIHMSPRGWKVLSLFTFLLVCLVVCLEVGGGLWWKDALMGDGIGNLLLHRMRPDPPSHTGQG